MDRIWSIINGMDNVKPQYAGPSLQFILPLASQFPVDSWLEAKLQTFQTESIQKVIMWCRQVMQLNHFNCIVIIKVVVPKPSDCSAVPLSCLIVSSSFSYHLFFTDSGAPPAVSFSSLIWQKITCTSCRTNELH